MTRSRPQRWLAVAVSALALALLVGAAGWLLLLVVKGTVVLATYALGLLLIVAPLLMARRLVGDRVGRARWDRIGAIASSVAMGVALLVVAHEVSRHGWLLIVVPAGVIVVARALTALRAESSDR